MRIELLDGSGDTIIATREFASAQYGEEGVGWRVAVVQDDAAPLAADCKITRLAFLDRFTDAEAVAIDLASIGATQQAAGLRRYVAKVEAATFIDLQRADTRAGVQALEVVGILAAGRALQILDAPVQPIERYLG